MEKNPKQKINIQIIISRALRVGIIISGVLFTLGMILYSATGNASFPSGRVSLLWIFNALLSLNPAAVILLGAIILIATPAARVLVAAFTFFLEKDHLYTVLALLVFTILVISFLLASI